MIREHSDGLGAFAIEDRWKEELYYWEGGHGLAFSAGWGVSPPVASFPDPSDWPSVAPEWARGRYDVILERMRAHSGHVIEIDPAGETRFAPFPVTRGETERGSAGR